MRRTERTHSASVGWTFPQRRWRFSWRLYAPPRRISQAQTKNALSEYVIITQLFASPLVPVGFCPPGIRWICESKCVWVWLFGSYEVQCDMSWSSPSCYITRGESTMAERLYPDVWMYVSMCVCVCVQCLYTMTYLQRTYLYVCAFESVRVWSQREWGNHPGKCLRSYTT